MGDKVPPRGRGRLVLILFGIAVGIAAALLLIPWRPAVQTVQAVPPAQQDQPIAFYLARADAARGEGFFARCAGCHTATAGTPHGVGPNLHGVMGRRIAAGTDYSYSAALSGRGGTWDWEAMNGFLADPRAYAPGTRMAFAGVSNPQDRADLMLWLNRQGGTLAAPAGAR